MAAFLQRTTPGRTNTKLVADVMVNVTARCVVRVDNTPPLPFHLGNPKRQVLAFDTGLLDLSALAEDEQPKLLPHDPDWFSISVLPYAFNPTAKSPRFREFLGQIMNADPKTLQPKTKGDNRILVVQEWFGYSLLADNRLQKFAIFLGEGWNGKGTLLHVWHHLLGADNIASVGLESLGREFGTESLVGKTLNLSGDMAEIDNAAEGALKAWTGEDPITVYRKYRSLLQFVPNVKFVFATNQLPFFKDKSNGTWRRMIVVPFTFALRCDEEADPRLRVSLREELPAIMNWALRGLARLLKQGRFTACDVCMAAAAEHRSECSPVRRFISNHFTLCLEFEGAKDGVIWQTTTAEIQSLVKNYVDRVGDKSIHANIVCRELAKLPGVAKARPTTTPERIRCGGNIYHGVCIGEPKQIIPCSPKKTSKNVVRKASYQLVPPYRMVLGDNGKPTKPKATSITAPVAPTLVPTTFRRRRKPSRFNGPRTPPPWYSAGYASPPHGRMAGLLNGSCHE